MSTAANEPAEGDGPRVPWGRLALRTIALLAAASSLVALWSGERARIADDLQLFAEPRARPGEDLALRALWLRDVDAPEGPSLGTAPVRVRLLDRQGRELARTTLTSAVLEGMEGDLRVPDVSRGEVHLEAELEDGTGSTLSVARKLYVAADVPAPAPVARLAGPLQHFVVGRVVTVGTGQPPHPFLPRVVGGSCMPEQICRVLVWVGEPAASIELGVSASATPVAPPDPATETTGLVSLSLRVHGAEAEITLRALRGGQAVAERPLRLPVALGETGLSSDMSLVPAGSQARLTLTPPPGREHVIVDTFVSGRWARSTTVKSATQARGVPVVFSPQVTGLVRVQGRSDRYTGEGAGARVLYIQRPGEGVAQALSRIAAAARQAGLADPARPDVEAALPPQARDDAQRWAAFLLAPFELSRMAIPLAVGGRPRQLSRIAHRRTLVRYGVAAMLVCCALVFGVTVVRRGWAATDEAGALLHEASLGTGLSPVRRRGDRLWVLMWVALVCMAFLAAALMIVAKPLWF